MMHTPHFMVGVAIAMHVPDPVTAGIAAVTTHFVLDAVPHSDYIDKPEISFANLALVVGDVVLALTLLILLVPETQWAYAFLIGALANLPDLLWVPKYFWTKWEKLPIIRQFGHWHGTELQYQRELPFDKRSLAYWFFGALPQLAVVLVCVYFI